MRIQTEEWRKFIPGIRMYKGKKTLFYNGEILWDPNDWSKPLVREKFQAIKDIIVLPGVEIISTNAFDCCKERIETVIMADTVTRIEQGSFYEFKKLVFVKLSRNIDYIGSSAFRGCLSLKSFFVPPSCREIGDCAFKRCFNLLIFNLHQHTSLRIWALVDTSLVTNSASDEEYRITGDIRSIPWVKSINNDDEYGLHRLCSSMDPSEDEIYQMICEKGGLHAMAKKNCIGISPSEYLASNPYADVDEMKLIKRFALKNIIA
ncbi:leucine-rich repeat domain-containing protein [Chaetoceros tenuissimus]|uniref:Leucine-rich repeat domain-containing protein n=1 Tax=Chaetoceros tenuissimus TaxID=426638 RepID=A0AAD3DBU7_9STRA|nr:leucine-rich repeat domain-containing protein [Chaetoceros tenuissimus]